MKKLLVLLLALLMVVSLAACGGSKKDTDKKEGTESVKKDSETKNDTADNTDDNGDAFKTALFTLDYDDTVWIMDDDDISDYEDYCSVILEIMNPDDPENYLIHAYISVGIDEPYSFRDNMVEYGFDQYEYAENNAYDLVSVGGVDCLKCEGESWGETQIMYLGRAESESATVCVNIYTPDAEDSRIADLLAGLSFTLTDTGNEDGPWEWEGEPFSAENSSVTAGSFTVESTWLPINDYISTIETFNHAVAAVDDTVYILTEGVLKQYSYDGSALNYEKDIELPEDDYEIISKADDGSLWISGGMNDPISIKDGEVVATYEGLDDMAISPDGSWGISYFVGNECQKVTFDGASCTTDGITFPEADTLSYVRVDNDYIYVCAYATDESGHKVFIYNIDGELQNTLCDADGESLGSITYIAKTDNGFIAFDGNMRTVMLWDAEGEFIAEIEDSELFGTNYPWFCGSDTLSDGSIITVMTETREDKSATELAAFIVKGF